MPSTNKKNRGKGKKQKSEKKQIVTSKKSKCTGCDKIGEDFKVCSACKMAKYCTSSCQRAHWPEHKSTCKVLALNLMGLGKPKLRFKVGGEYLFIFIVLIVWYVLISNYTIL
jgi:hypothetical protein